MTHTLKLTNGSKRLASSILNVPEFKTHGERFKAGLLQELLEVTGVPFERDLQRINPQTPLTDATAAMVEAQTEFFNVDVDVELTEKQRDFLRSVCIEHASKLPTGKVTNRLLKELGLDEGF
jgi:hypothetical protein